MRGVLIAIEAYDPVERRIQSVRIGAARNTRTLGAGGERWQSVITRLPRLSMELLDDDMTGKLMVGRGEFTFNALALRDIPNAAALEWKGAQITVYSGDSDRMADLTVEFFGRCTSGSTAVDTGIVPIQMEVDQAPYNVPLLTLEYPGGIGINGDVELKGVSRPAGFGHPVNFPPVLINQVYSVYQVDGYGNTVSIDGVFENLASFGPPIGDYAYFDTLVAADIPEGSWATCLALGLFRLGAAPVGTITADATFGSSRPGSVILRWLTVHAARPFGTIRVDTLDALTAAVDAVAGGPAPVSFWTTDTNNVLDLVQRMCASCNAMPLLMLDGTFAVSRIFGGDELLTLNRAGGTPVVTGWLAGDPTVPWWRLRMSAAKVVYVNPSSEIDYEETINPRGLYDAGEVYRKGDLVDDVDGAQYLFISDTPTAGAAFPTPPSDQNAFWSTMKPATVVDFANVIGDTRPTDYADVTGDNISKGTASIGPKPTGVFLEDFAANLRMTLLQVGRLDLYEQFTNDVFYKNGQRIDIQVAELNDRQITDSGAFDVRLSKIAVMSADGTTARIVDSLLYSNANGDQVYIAQDLRTLFASNSEHTGQIQDIQKIVLTPNGSYAKIAMLADLDGSVVGWEGTTDGKFSRFVIKTNELRLMDDQNTAALYPFSYVNKRFYLDDVYIRLLEVGAVKSDSIALNAVTKPIYWQASYGGLNGKTGFAAPSENVWYEFGASGSKATTGAVPMLAGAGAQLSFQINVSRSGGNNDVHRFRVKRVGPDGTIYLPSSPIIRLTTDIIVASWTWIDASVPQDGTFTYTIEFNRMPGDGTYYEAALAATIYKR